MPVSVFSSCDEQHGDTCLAARPTMCMQFGSGVASIVTISEMVGMCKIVQLTSRRGKYSVL